METSEVRKRVLRVIDRARRSAADRHHPERSAADRHHAERVAADEGPAERSAADQDPVEESAADRRARNDAAVRSYERFLDDIAIPIFRQVAGALKASTYNFTVFTPGGSVRLMSDKAAEDYIELSLDTTGSRPAVVGRTRRVRRSRGVETERPIAEKTVDALTDGDVLEFLIEELPPFVER